MEGPLDLKQARLKYHGQKNGAKKRGIGWDLTFQQWLDWWGEDLDRRGSRRDNLQMQRIADVGPYRIGNIRKGVPKQNGATYSNSHQNRKSAEAAKLREAAQDALMFAPSAEPVEDEEDVPISEYFKRQGRIETVATRFGKE